MKVNINGKQYRVYWEHHSPESQCTTCIIQDINSNEVVAKGVSILHPKDCYNKKVGRKVTLAKALAESFTSKTDNAFAKDVFRNQRKAFWDAYKDMVHGNWD